MHHSDNLKENSLNTYHFHFSVPSSPFSFIFSFFFSSFVFIFLVFFSGWSRSELSLFLFFLALWFLSAVSCFSSVFSSLTFFFFILTGGLDCRSAAESQPSWSSVLIYTHTHRGEHKHRFWICVRCQCWDVLDLMWICRLRLRITHVHVCCSVLLHFLIVTLFAAFWPWLRVKHTTQFTEESSCSRLKYWE